MKKIALALTTAIVSFLVFSLWLTSEVFKDANSGAFDFDIFED